MSRYLGVEEVHQLIPQLKQHLEALMACKKAMTEASLKLQAMGVRPQLLGRLSSHYSLEAHRINAEMRRHYEEYKKHLHAIEQMGGQVKDLEAGQVDFPSKNAAGPGVYRWAMGEAEKPVFTLQ